MRPLIYLSTFYPSQKRDFFLEKLLSAANISASAFSYSLLQGLEVCCHNNLYVVNTPLTGPFPIRYRRFYTKKSVDEECGYKISSVGCCNLYGIQGPSISHNVSKAMRNLGIGDSDILLYSIHLPLLKAAVAYKKKFKGSRIILVVPDLFEDISKQTPLKQMYRRLILGDFPKLCNYVDGYVLLTEQMLERMPARKPYCVVEGIYNPMERRYGTKPNKNFNILYTGMLYEKFGVKNLIDAVCSLDNPNIRLQLCGSGDLVDYIKEKSINDSRIEFKGIVPREKVLELQCEASLLVNPRQPNGGFTRYSFPSKNIEYLASGTPTLLYELEGIPQEYYQYCYHLSAGQSSVDDLTEMIKQICETPLEERTALAKKAQNFIFTEKNAPTQCAKIIHFIENL